jgi:hypothetical protein
MNLVSLESVFQYESTDTNNKRCNQILLLRFLIKVCLKIRGMCLIHGNRGSNI